MKTVLPVVHPSNIGRLMFLLTKFLINDFSRIRYVEPSYCCESNTILWLIEYSSVLNFRDYKHLSTILTSFKLNFERLFHCKVISINYNLKDRISLKVSVNKRTVTTDVGITKHPGIGFVQSSKKTLEEEKREFSNDKTQCRKKSRRSKNSKEQAILKYKFRLVDKEDIDGNNVEKKISVECTQPMKDKDRETKEKLSDDGKKASSGSEDNIPCDRDKDNVTPFRNVVARLSSMSRSHARARLNDAKIYASVRLYIAYLGHQKIDVVFEGNTKVSLGTYIQSEGLPLGQDLTELWYEYGKARGLTDAEIRTDLESYQAYCMTSRILRLESARKGVRSWLGLRGGCTLPLTPLKYSVVDRHHPVKVSLDNQEFERFN